jgi:hypothetical protein
MTVTNLSHLTGHDPCLLSLPRALADAAIAPEMSLPDEQESPIDPTASATPTFLAYSHPLRQGPMGLSHIRSQR